jgi:tetratricopeptide (TPR) repeat protein
VRNPEPLSSRGSRKLVIAICGGLIALVWLIYGQTLRHEFVNYDDNVYIYENPHVTTGLNLNGLAWAFSHVYSSNWHPVTAISHMADCEFFDLNAGGHHFTNVLLHTITSVLLLLVLREMSGAVWRSGFVAAVFAVHPLHVESVAWIAERKDILSGLFFVLTLGAYIRYVRAKSIRRYLLVVFLLALGLMSKPMLVTIPFILLLLDYWPLRRSAAAVTTRSLLIEKIPLFILSVASCAATLIAQRGSMVQTEQLPMMSRLGNAIVTCVTYLRQMLWPRNLACFYPYSNSNLTIEKVAIAIGLIAAASIAAIYSRETRPYFFTGWFWHLGMLVPVIGLVQVGLQSHADRYTYLPQIGLYLAVAWGASDVASQLRFGRQVLSILAVSTIIISSTLASIQAGYWRTSDELWKHTLAVTNDNDIAHYGLGDVYMRRGQFDEAVTEFSAAERIRPESPDAKDYLGVALLKNGQTDEAIDHLKAALRLMPSHPTAHFDLANALFQQGDVAGAISEYQQHLNTRAPRAIVGFAQPDYATAHYDLGNCYVQRGDLNLAVKEYDEALKLSPRNSQARNNLGFALSQLGKTREAVAEWEVALHTEPNNIEVLANLAWILATSSDASIRDGRHALVLADRAKRLSGSNPKILRVLAAAYAEAGKFQEAIDAANRGLELANKEGDTGLTEDFQSDLESYRSNTALRN